ncbi:MAG TPA: chorismate mutase [Acidimicrobiales bacterium]|nr:chorismate mutase [Acidimicrobiales bacterium]
MSPSVRGIRGATTIDADTAEQVSARVQELVTEMLERNNLAAEDLVSVILTATEDVTSMYPATAARGLGLDDVPLLGAREISVEGGLPRCVRVLIHAETDLSREKVRHVYLHGARVLRDDLPD